MADRFHRRRVLVVSNETVEADVLRETIAAHARAIEVFVVAPALNTRFATGSPTRIPRAAPPRRG